MIFRYMFCLFFIIILTQSCFYPVAEKTPGIIRIGLEGRPTNLDPRYATDAASSKLCELIFSSLLYKDQTMQLRGDLAESWEIEDDLTYKFHIRPGVTFHDGSPLTASSIKTTIESILDPKSASPKKADYQYLKRLDILDRRTIRIRLSEPFAPFLNSMTIGIMPERCINRDDSRFSERPIGSGPFRLTRHVAGREILLEKNERFYGVKPALKGIQFKIIKDGMIRALELMKGTIELTQNDIPPRFVTLLADQPDVKLEYCQSNNYSYIGFNCEHPVLSQIDVRQAIALAINREAIIQRVFNGLAVRATGLLAPHHWAYNGNVRTYDHNPENAKKLLDSCGFHDPDGDGPLPRFELEYKTSQNPFRLMIATIIQRDLSRIGISVKIQSLEWPTFYDDIKKGNFEIYSLMWVGVDEPDLFHHLFHSASIPPNGANRGRFRNMIIDSLVEKARHELNQTKRKNLYGQVQKILADEVPYVSLWHEFNVAAMRQYVKNYQLFADARYRGLINVTLEGEHL